MAIRVIYKYTLGIVDQQNVTLPRGAKVLTAQVQYRELQLWALVDPNQPLTKVVSL